MSTHDLPSIGGGSRPVQSIGAVGSPNEQGAPAQSAAFEALLTRLEDRAAELARTADGGLDAAGLGRAVDEAGASLRDAMQLSNSLLEAYRAARSGSGSTNGETR
jgi:hypothetical protein